MEEISSRFVLFFSNSTFKELSRILSSKIDDIEIRTVRSFLSRSRFQNVTDYLKYKDQWLDVREQVWPEFQ